MGKRGPKPTSQEKLAARMELLKMHTENWARFLHKLRDGEPGKIQEVIYKPWKKWREGKRILRYRKLTILRAKIVPVEGNWKNWPIETKLPGRNPTTFFRPITGAPHLWEKLKEDRSAASLQQTVTKIRKWWKKQSNGSLPVPTMSRQNPLRLLASKQLLDAKKLWNYPNGNLRYSDDRRIEFMAKSLAGLMCGIAPATATARYLLHWHPQIESVEQSPHASADTRSGNLSQKRTIPSPAKQP